MHLQSLRLFNFKNHREAELDFSEGLNCIVGDNGTGKTNLLDAIHFLCLTKSALGLKDKQLILHGEQLFLVQANVKDANYEHSLRAGFQEAKKQFLWDQVPYDRLSDHIGKIPIVFAAPNDVDLIHGGNEERRKFFDALLSQFDPYYLRDAIRYNQNLKQRNALLRQFAEHGRPDADLLEPYDHQLATLGKALYEKRKALTEEFLPHFQSAYNELSGGREEVNLSYRSHLENPDFLKELQESHLKDTVLKYSTMGIHRDAYRFNINGKSLKLYGSQGQQKCFVTALKLAQFHILEERTGKKPLLLLDDIFDRLDEHRTKNLLQMVTEGRFGQVFLTDANPKRSQTLFEELDPKPKVFELPLHS